ncbi:MAG: type II toxin-antitoxin system Phd/YefM family antitoxin [Rhodothalassiaceae bacterium]
MHDDAEWISAAEANRRFPRLLAAVRCGRRFIVTSHGEPVACVMPVRDAPAARTAARRALIARLRAQRPVDIGPWRRDELYEHSRQPRA